MAQQRRRRWRDLGRKRDSQGRGGRIAGIAMILAVVWLAVALGIAWNGKKERTEVTVGAVPETEKADATLEQEISAHWGPEWQDRMGPLATMRREDPAVVRVETGRGVVLWFNEEGVERQFRNLEGIWRHAEEEGRDLATVNLVPERNLPVTFRSGTGN